MIYVTKLPRRTLEIRYKAGETRDLCPVCEVGVDIAARATEQIEIRLHSKYRKLEWYMYINCICLTNIYWFL